jgi:filamentous hemagglutinin family protein
MPTRRRPGLRRALLQGVSATALLATCGVAVPGAANAGSFRSISQALAANPAASAQASANGASVTAARQAALGAQNVAAAAQKFLSLSQALAAVRYTGPAVPDGIAPGGLQQAAGVAGSNNSTLWSGASTTLTQTVSNGITDVTVDQTGAVASLTWQTMNVGAHTKLIFDQSAGGSLASTWVAINTITDPLLNPTTILGDISASGKIFIINPNGVLFGSGAQVNVGSLIAATASIAQAQLTQDDNGLVNGFNLYGSATGTTNLNTFTPTFIDASSTGSIVVQPGASIVTTAPSGNASGGYVMLLADTVQNQGVISTPSGQTVLAAGTNFIIQPGYSFSNPTATVIGSEVAVTNSLSGSLIGTLGTALNTGIVVADQGDITMVGHTVEQAGVLLATTTVDVRGTVHLLTDTGDDTASVVLEPGSVTEILPEDNGETALDSQRASNLAASIVDNAARLTPTGPILNDYNTLADTLGESRVEISTGGSVTMDGGALVLAQGGQVAVGAGQAVTLASGAMVDVSGTSAYLPALDNSLLVTDIVPYYTRDSAGNRNSGVEGETVSVDERTLVEIASGAYAGNIYTAGGLLEVSGNLGLVPHGIDEWSAIGGQVTLQSASNVNGTLVGGTVTVAAGSTINLTGGTVTYDAGMVPQSYVETTSGQIYNVNTAPGNLVYTGVYTGQTVAHPRWSITQTFTNPLLTPAEIYEPAYLIGRDAGSLTIASASGVIAGTVDTGVTVGAGQTGARPADITDPFLLAQSVAPLPGGLEAGIYEGGAQYGTLTGSLFLSNILITGQGPVPPPILTALPDAVLGTITVDGAALLQDQFANITFYTAGGIALVTPMAVSSGGTVTLGGAVVEDAGSITAHDGGIELTNLLPSDNGLYSPISSAPGTIAVLPGSVLDASGTWTNLQRDPANVSQEGYAAGGNVTILGTGPVDLAAGSVLDVASGGVLSDAGKLTTEAGGNITVSADIVPLEVSTLNPTGAVTYAAQFVGYASGAGGTLSLSAPNILIGNDQPGSPSTIVENQALFADGFGDYVLNADAGLSVDPGAQLDVTRAVYTLANPALQTGAPAADAFNIILAPLYVQTKGGDNFTQRAGASLALESSVYSASYDGGGGDVTIGAGAQIAVDPGQSITVAGYGQVTVLGTLTAHGGAITVGNTRYEQTALGDIPDTQTNYIDGLSVWIGDGALLDASGQATIFTDALGRTFGESQAGGTILLGGLGGTNANSPESSFAQVIVRQGATLDVQGASATVDVVPTTESPAPPQTISPVTLSGAGGTIVARSYDGVALDGTMLAAGAGAGAAGGSLIMRLDPENLEAFYGLPADYYVPSQIVITQNAVPVQPISGIQPGDPTVPATLRLGGISQQQISQGGFDSVNLYAQDQIVFDGSVDLTVGRSLTLSTTIVGDTQASGSVSVTVPYLSLFGYSSGANDGLDPGLPASTSMLSSAASLTLNADLIDITNQIDLGGDRLVGAVYSGNAGSGTILGTVTAQSYGFEIATINSAGDIRFDQDSGQVSNNETTVLASSGNIVFDAQQLYPTTEAVATVIAGQQLQAASGTNQLAGGTLTVLAQPGGTPQAPFSVGGTLSLIADNVVQDGVVRAPEGVLKLGIARNSGPLSQLTDSVTLGTASVTSVSLYGQIVPYGGTVDGVNYLYDGQAPLAFDPVVQIAAAQVSVDSGAVIDLRGGGTLAGAGFIAGRGGSADVNLTPLLNSGSGTIVSGTTDPVFAIVPGTQSQYVPVAPGDAGYDTPTPGEQIVIRAGEVAGLAAGTYTLLPAYYDLLPGAFRVELTSAPMQPGNSASFGNFTTEAAVTVGVANTSIAGAVPVEALITPEAGVLQLSQYDQESYNQFEISQAATFNAPRPLLPQDAKTLLIELNAPAGTISANDQPISIDAGALLQSAPSGGYGATMEITAQVPIEVLGTGDSVVPYPPGGTSGDFGVSSAMLDALNLPRLVIGGTLTADPTYSNQVDIQGVTPDVLILGHADLAAGDIMLTAVPAGTVMAETGATISTLGEPSTAYGLSQGIYFSSDDPVGASPVLALSNNQIVFVPNSFASSGAIVVQSGVTLQAGGSLDFTAPQGASVQVGNADLQAAYVNVQVADINIGSAAALSSFGSLLPAGLTLDDATLNVLAQGATELTLSADLAVNMVGSVALDSGSTSLVLNTPAIYGYGISTTTTSASGSVTTLTTDPGNVTIKAPSFTWSGVSTEQQLQTGTTTVSASPGGQLAGSVPLSNGSMTLAGAAGLTIDANTIDLGYGPETQVDDQVVLNRLAVGFGTVTLQASQEITANNQSSLSVFATQTTYGQPGTGGDLTLATPLVTAASGAVLDLTAGDTLSAGSGGATPAATGTISTLGATIDLTADTVDTSTAFAFPSGKISILAADGIDLASGTNLDLSGRAIKLFDQTAYSTGGTLIMEADASNAGSITEDDGAAINVSANHANAGSVTATAGDGEVSFNGSLLGTSSGGYSSGGFTVYALSLPDFDALNTLLDQGGFMGARNFEAATGDILVDQTVTAGTVTISADTGNIDVSGTINASSSGPGSIALSAGQTLTLEGTAVLDAQATTTHTDSYQEEINAENSADVTLTSAGGSVLLNPGATIDVGYPGAASNPQGEIVINAPRAGTDSVAVSAPGSLNIIGAASIVLNAFRTYSPTDADGTVVQNNGTGLYLGSGYSAISPTTGYLGIFQVGLDNEVYMSNVDDNGAALNAQLAGLAAFGSNFHLRPGVLIESTAATNNNLTISGDLDFARLRYSDPSGFGSLHLTEYGGEPGSVVFRAQNDLTVNGSVSDGFVVPPDSSSGTVLSADVNGWTYLGNPAAYTGEATNADLLLPAGAVAVVNGKTSSTQILLLGSDEGGDTTFDTTRPISLNYAIVISAANVNADVTIPFALTIGSVSTPIPAGGWVATAAIMRNGAVLFAKGQVIPAGFTFEPGDVLEPGSVLPVGVQTGVTNGTDPATGQPYMGQLIPSGTEMTLFSDPYISLVENTAVLPQNALIPSNTVADFGAMVAGDPNALPVKTLELRPTEDIDGNEVQGYLYPLSPMMNAGTLSWSMDFVSGANLGAANVLSVQPLSTLNGGVFTPPAGMTDAAAGSMLLDDQHYYADVGGFPSLAFSVIRTGTGDLSLVAGGDIDQSSLYGIYTAGTPDPLPSGNGQFNSARELEGGTYLLPGKGNEAASNLISATYDAYYPTDGGNVLFAAQGNVTGDLYATTLGSGEVYGTPASDAIGNWLWRQGSTQLGQPTAWWINFGTLVEPLDNLGAEDNPVQMVGFQGIGALGGGNVTVTIGGNAGQMTDRDEGGAGAADQGADNQRGEGLVIAVGSTGRLVPGSSTPVITGGGDINVTIGGVLNPIDAAAYGIGATATGQSNESPAVDGDIIDLRGNINVTAGAIGRIDPVYEASAIATADPRALDPFTSEDGIPNGGIEVEPGDGTVDISTLRDLVLAGAADPGRVTLQSFTDLTGDGHALHGYENDGGDTGFTLWQSSTSIDLFSDGGDVTPTTVPNESVGAIAFANDLPTDYRSIYPPTLLVTAAEGNIIYGQYGVTPASLDAEQIFGNPVDDSLETMPAPYGDISFLAGKSIFANFYPVDMSGANPAGLSTPFDPAFTTDPDNSRALTNILTGLETSQTPEALFALEADTPSTNLHADDTTPARFYAADGDVLDFQTGETLSFIGDSGNVAETWYIAAKPVWILASQDIVSTGTRPAADPNSTIFAVQENQNESQSLLGLTEYSSGNLFLNNNAQSVSVMSAGRDILSAYTYVGGPGLLEVQAGRNLYEASSVNTSGQAQVLSFGSIKSLGDDLITGSPVDLSGGAGISVLAGVGAAGPDYTAFADLYFNPDNQANLALPLTDPANAGKVQQVYTSELVTWLALNYGYTGTGSGALAAFLALPAIDQDVFVRQVFFDELQASGAQEANPSSRFFKSYARGRLAIDTLLPSLTAQTTPGVPAGYTGDITMYSGTVLSDNGTSGQPLMAPGGGDAIYDGGIATLFGGSVQVIDPGGQATFGVPGGPAPGNNSGIVTYGSGDIDIYSLGNVLLGKSRIFTTAGGNILIWSSAGDINAGIGAKTTQVYDPPVLVYDDLGDVTDTPPAITTGAGIATLQPLPDIPAGDVNLIAPLGTIDAGEAGIRVSGNLVLAAARVTGAAGIQVKGSTTGAPTVSVASLGAVEAAGSAAGAAANAAQTQGQRTSDADQTPSVLDVEIISVGGSGGNEKKRKL